MPKGLERRYGQRQLHFITCSCDERRPLFDSGVRRNLFLEVLDVVRKRYEFSLDGCVVMPDHVHLLIGEPGIGTPSTVMQVLKQITSRRARGELLMLKNSGGHSFWERRFYDFNVWSRSKRNEKLHYMHFNPVERGLVADPRLWPWSSYRFYRWNLHAESRTMVSFDAHPRRPTLKNQRVGHPASKSVAPSVPSARLAR